jgi:hypothetical protein
MSEYIILLLASGLDWFSLIDLLVLILVWHIPLVRCHLRIRLQIPMTKMMIWEVILQENILCHTDICCIEKNQMTDPMLIYCEHTDPLNLCSQISTVKIKVWSKFNNWRWAAQTAENPVWSQRKVEICDVLMMVKKSCISIISQQLYITSSSK